MVRRRVRVGHYQVRYRHPWRGPVLTGVGLIVLVLAVVMAYRVGHGQGLMQEDNPQAVKAIAGSSMATDPVYRQLRQRVAVLERTLIIEREASEQVRSTLHDMEQRIHQLTEELDFYRAIIAPEDLERGLHIHRVRVRPDPVRSGEYLYHVVLTQVQGARMAEGVLRLSLKGHQDGQPVRHDHGAIFPDETGGRPFSFRYFQALEGRLVLPEALLPEQLIVQADPAGGLRSTERSLPWSSLVSSSAP
ncbi:hypothetical protein SAMN05421693_1306 [Ectothiorhodospira magna]|uniref:Uncharacterized protein n=1 Tax=Ectothiorhodospira magna TaxID=867345 RepID=A0A1H9FUE4_9GAMM|nr:hypothetical protein SAMN05421693_1306 [Ectothiorhodospira magna]